MAKNTQEEPKEEAKVPVSTNWIFLYPTGEYAKKGFSARDQMPHPVKGDEILRIYRYEIDERGKYKSGDDEGGRKRRKITDADGVTKDMIWTLKIDSPILVGDGKRQSQGYTKLHPVHDKDIIDQLKKHPANEAVKEYDGIKRTEKFGWYPILFRLEDPEAAAKAAREFYNAKNEVFKDIDSKDEYALAAACVMVGIPIDNQWGKKDSSEMKQQLMEFAMSKTLVEKDNQKVMPAIYYRKRVMDNANLDKELFLELCLTKKVITHSAQNGYFYITNGGKAHKAIGLNPADLGTFLENNPAAHKDIITRIDWNKYRKALNLAKVELGAEDKNLTDLISKEPVTPNVQATEMMAKLFETIKDMQSENAKNNQALQDKLTAQEEANAKLAAELKQIRDTQKSQSNVLQEIKLDTDKPTDDGAGKPPKK